MKKLLLSDLWKAFPVLHRYWQSGPYTRVQTVSDCLWAFVPWTCLSLVPPPHPIPHVLSKEHRLSVIISLVWSRMNIVVVVVVDVALVCFCDMPSWRNIRANCSQERPKLPKSLFLRRLDVSRKPPPPTHSHGMFHTQEVHTEAGTFSSSAGKPRHSPWTWRA